jgi:hypothetical protein
LIIYTSGITLLDGSVLRVPHTRIQDAAGRDMEMAPRSSTSPSIARWVKPGPIEIGNSPWR